MFTKILIIGAGAAGIAAATRLHKNGITDFVILEASNRIGGRIRTVLFGQNTIDLGAQWCHGVKNNVVFEMASPLGLLEESNFSRRNVLLFSDGTQAPTDVTDKLMLLAEEVLDCKEIRTTKQTLGDYFVATFMQKIADSQELNMVDGKLVEYFISFYHNYLKGYLAIDSWYNLLATSAADYEECEGPIRMSWKGNGFKTILDLLMNQYSDISMASKVLFNNKVSHIVYNNEVISVVCAGGTVYQTHHVIVTVSLGVLKECYESFFSPELPLSKINAINGLHFGVVNKVFMEFEQPFWKTRGNVFRLLWQQHDLENLRISQYSWAEGVSTFFCVDNCPNILAAWLVGPEGRQTESLSDAEVVDGLLTVLNRFFIDISIPKPINFIRSSWFSEPNFRGSYSSRSLKTEQYATGAKQLSEPVTDSNDKPILLFAGEATSANHWSTVHGAIETGWREAQRLVQYYKSV
ncbi:spermine oxidase-like [Topomyia yanbarensis]|uniref:spermine oxidase-like n=1 Tax=Topomyia yanbarensis TaxID=2498891 RepID=UPI00273B0B2E|nr:spermine oxidase-like [Topomyia yanbarensis]